MPSSRKIVPWFHGEVAKPLFAYFEHLDLPIEPYLERHKLPPEPNVIYRGVLPALRLLRFFDDLSHVYGSPMLMYEAQVYAAQKIRLDWQYGQQFAPTLRLSLEKTFAELQGHAYRRFSFLLGREYAMVSWPTDGLDNGIEAQAATYTFEVFINIVQGYLGIDWTPQYMGVPGRVMGQPCLATAFPKAQFYPLDEYWRFDIPRTALALPSLLQPELPSRLLMKSPPITDSNLPMVCRRILQTYLHSSYGNGQRLTIEDTADILELKPRTLQRRLQESGFSFSEVYDQASLEIAKTLLQDAPLNIAEISHYLGYSPSSFARTFRRLTGLSPLEYRRTFAI